MLVLALGASALAGIVLANSQQREGTAEVRDLGQGAASGSLYHPLSKEDKAKFDAIAKNAQDIEKEARQLLKERRFDEAEATCRRSLAVSIKARNGVAFNSASWQLLGEIYLAQERYRDAIDAFDKARLFTRDDELDLKTALAYVRLGDLEKASRFYSPEKRYAKLPEEQRKERLAQLPRGKDTKSVEANIFCALAGEKTMYGEEEEAAENYQKALDLFPRNGYFSCQLARHLMRLKRYDEALPMFALATHFGNPKQAKDARSTMLQRWPRAQAEAAMQAAAKIP